MSLSEVSSMLVKSGNKCDFNFFKMQNETNKPPNHECFPGKCILDAIKGVPNPGGNHKRGPPVITAAQQLQSRK